MTDQVQVLTCHPHDEFGELPAEVRRALSEAPPTGREILSCVYALRANRLCHVPVVIMRFGRDAGFVNEEGFFTFCSTVEDAEQKAGEMIYATVPGIRMSSSVAA